MTDDAWNLLKGELARTRRKKREIRAELCNLESRYVEEVKREAQYTEAMRRLKEGHSPRAQPGC